MIRGLQDGGKLRRDTADDGGVRMRITRFFVFRGPVIYLPGGGRMFKNLAVFGLLMAAVFLSGCGTLEQARSAEECQSRVRDLNQKLTELSRQKDELSVRNAELMESSREKISDLEKAKRDLAESLNSELNDYKAKLQMTERGLVITFMAEIFFDSGKVWIRESAKPILRKVARVLNNDVPDARVAVEGHTDDVPIRHSGWRSNWELSTGRSLSVLHYFIDECGVSPQRLSVNGYGEYRPVASNDTAAGRRQNRRVEIIILPSKISKVRK